MKTIDKYISTLKSAINSLNGDSILAEEYESQILLEFEDFKLKKQITDNTLAENKFVEGLEEPKTLAKSLLGLNQIKNTDVKIDLFSRNDWYIIANIYMLFYIMWFSFKILSSSLFIVLNRTVSEYKDFLVNFGYVAILSLYFWPLIYLLYTLLIKNITLGELKGKHVIMEILFVLFLALVGHFILVVIHNSLGKYVYTLMDFRNFILIPLFMIFLFTYIIIRLVIKEHYNRTAILLLIPIIIFLIMIFIEF